ncbi:MAG TPA: cytochrome c [Gemmatimonadaceae bacterium]|nr:cytochrome c [Gemmatimonadaceae bacterium]
MRDRSSWRERRVLIFIVPLMLGASGCEWFTDFKRQPSLWTWEPVKDSLTPSRGNPQHSVPVTGMAVAPFQVSYQPLPGTIDSMAGIANPHPVSEASLANGRKYFQINCAVCHGDAGMGDGPATKFGMPGINLITDITRSRTDGYIFGMIRNGRGLMPPYNRIEEPDRWDVVNYLRGLQGRAGQQVATGPLAPPGVTGDKVPGVTRMAPTRPAPFMDPRGRIVGGMPRVSLPRSTTPSAADSTTASTISAPSVSSRDSAALPGTKR